MKTQSDIDKTLAVFEKKFGLIVRGAPQLSDAWFHMKLGVISASNASRAVSKKGTATRNTFLCELVAEVCTSVIEEQSFKQMEWGKQHEAAARSSYEFANAVKMTPLSFVFKDETFRAGCSPDGIVSATKGAEIKCPWDTANYVKFLVGDEVKAEWEWQNEFTMWVMGAGEWDVVQFDPRMKTKPLHGITVPRNPERQKRLDDEIPELIFDMDKILAQIGVKFGQQWERLATKDHGKFDVARESRELVVQALGRSAKNTPQALIPQEPVVAAIDARAVRGYVRKNGRSVKPYQRKAIKVAGKSGWQQMLEARDALQKKVT